MTITPDRRELYPSMTEIEIATVDAAYTEVVRVFRENNFNTLGDDRAENLVGAIARFLEDSKS